MTTNRRTHMANFEGRRVSLALADGSRIDDCELVLVGRFKAWVFTNGHDAFVALNRVVDFWEPPSLSAAGA